MEGHLKLRLPENWSSVGDLVPALDHEGVHPAGAILGARQQLSTSDHLNNLNNNIFEKIPFFKFCSTTKTCFNAKQNTLLFNYSRTLYVFLNSLFVTTFPNLLQEVNELYSA